MRCKSMVISNYAIYLQKKISTMRIVGLGNALTDVLARLHSDACFEAMGLLKGVCN